MKKINKIIALFLVCCNMILSFNILSYATNVQYTYASLYKDLIPIEATEYVQENYTYIMEAVEENLCLFDLQETQLENVDIGMPYIIYNIEEDYYDTEIYYYPVIDKLKDEIILIINLIGTTTGWSMSIDQNFVSQLNEIDYLNNNYVLYSDEDATIAENRIESIVLTGAKSIEINNYEKESWSKKIQNIRESLTQKKKIDTKVVKGGVQEKINSSRGYSVNTATQKVCTLYNSKGQGNLPICWAASVATIVNYINGFNVSATDVCDAMKTGYTGQGISMKQSALCYYGIDFYNIAYEQVSWSRVKYNINYKYPIAASLYSEDGCGHAVTVMGYKEITGSRNPRYYLTIWNSGLNDGVGGTQIVCYQYTDTSITYANKVFVWKYSLY